MADKGILRYLPDFRHFATDAIHVAQEPEQWNSWAVVPPITLSTTFKQKEPGKNNGYVYTRFGNPNRDILEKVMAALDGAKYCLAYSSGIGAIMNICQLLKTGDTIICTDDVYGGTRVLFEKIAKDYNLEVCYVDCTNLEELDKVIGKLKPKLVWIESPTNPTLKVIDIRACAEVVHRHKNVLLAVDNSFMSPYLQRPLSLGADICMSSATKYINGHGDVLMGLVCVNDDKLYKELKFLQSALGAVPSPFDCYLCNRGLKTLHIRMKLHFKNALAVAHFLKSHCGVDKVLYPGLPCHPRHDVMQKQSTGCSGVISFYIKGNINNAFAFLKNLKVFALGFSVGGFESLAEHPATMTHASVPEEERKALGITDTLIRLSVGLEDEEDLLADLDQALKAAAFLRTDERKRNSLSWTRREEQKQSHSSHKPCVLFPGSVTNPGAAFGEGFHASSQLPSHSCRILDQEMASLDLKFQDTTSEDCTANTCLKRERALDVRWRCSCLFPDIGLLDLGLLCWFLGWAVLSLDSRCVSLGACPAWQLCPAFGGGEEPCPSACPEIT